MPCLHFASFYKCYLSQAECNIEFVLENPNTRLETQSTKVIATNSTKS